MTNGFQVCREDSFYHYHCQLLLGNLIHMFHHVPMSHNQHQTHQPLKVWPNKNHGFCFVATLIESVPRVSVKSPAIHPGFKIHHHQSQRRRPNVAGMPFRTPCACFLFLKKNHGIRHHGRGVVHPAWGNIFCFIYRT